MMTKWFTIAIAVVGVLIGIYTVATTGDSEPEPPPAAAPSVNPFVSGIAATGLVEASSRNVHVSPPEAGLVLEVMVGVGARVEEGAALFRLDARPLEAQLASTQAMVDVAEADEGLQRLELERLREVLARGAATEQEVARQAARTDAAVAQRRQAEAEVERLRRDIERLTVVSPVAGTVLKRNIEPGEYATPGPSDGAALVVGDLTSLHVRAQVDEADAPRLRAGAAAVARVRGLAEASIPLKMLRIEPYAMPKRQITGDAAELVDTRVVEAVFRVEGEPAAPIYPGQVVDVYIEAVATSGGITPENGR